jgi:hypothetical protein
MVSQGKIFLKAHTPFPKKPTLLPQNLMGLWISSRDDLLASEAADLLALRTGHWFCDGSPALFQAPGVLPFSFSLHTVFLV